MDFEYGCVTANKFCFPDDNECEDPSELLAQVTIAKDAKETAAKDAAKKDAKGKKIDPKTGKPVAAKDAKKQPLQQQTDNLVKSKAGGADDKKDGSPASNLSFFEIINLINIVLLGKQRQTDAKSAATGAPQQKEDKENTSNKQTAGYQGERRTGEFQNRPDRRPRQEGEGGFRNDRPPRQEGEGGFRSDRPPRRTGPRPEGEGGFRGDRPDRPPRQFRRPEPQFDSEGNAILPAEGEAGNTEGYRGAGGYRGGRGGNTEGYRPTGGYRGGRGGNAGEGRKYDRHSGSEKT